MTDSRRPVIPFSGFEWDEQKRLRNIELHGIDVWQGKMSEKHIIKQSWKSLKKGQTDFARIQQLADKEIAEAVANDPDAAPLDIDWSKAELFHPTKKKPVSIRLDEDIVAYFKKMGRGYQTRINSVLRSYMNHHLSDEK